MNNEIEKLKKEIEELKKQLYIEKQKNQKLMWLIGLTNANGLMEKNSNWQKDKIKKENYEYRDNHYYNFYFRNHDCYFVNSSKF